MPLTQGIVPGQRAARCIRSRRKANHRLPFQDVLIAAPPSHAGSGSCTMTATSTCSAKCSVSRVAGSQRQDRYSTSSTSGSEHEEVQVAVLARLTSRTGAVWHDLEPPPSPAACRCESRYESVKMRVIWRSSASAPRLASARSSDGRRTSWCTPLSAGWCASTARFSDWDPGAMTKEANFLPRSPPRSPAGVGRTPRRARCRLAPRVGQRPTGRYHSS